VIRAARHLENVRYAIRNIAAEASRLEAQGQRILHCNIGDPVRYGFTPPPHLVEAVTKALRDGAHGYAPSPGLLSAREAIARRMATQGLPHVSPADVFVTSGVSEAIDLLMTALLEPGDEVLLPSPGYPLYNAVAARLQAKVVSYQLDEARGWALDVAALEALVTPRTRALVLCNPNNPTGAVADVASVKALLEVARRHQLPVLADEIYDQLLFDEVHVPIATLAPPDVPLVVLNGLSKSHLVPGWRQGWMVFATPHLLKDVMQAIGRLTDARLCGPTPLQAAIAPALDGPQTHLGPLVETLRRRRDLTVARLNAIEGISCVAPRGAFYAMPRLQLPGLQSDEQFVLKLVRETGVLFVHGEGFGQAPGTHHFRVVFLPPEETLREAFDRLADFVSRWKA
jgi:alanine-synthesizing transaminase